MLYTWRFYWMWRVEQIGFKVSNGILGSCHWRYILCQWKYNMQILMYHFNPSFHWFKFRPRLLIHYWLLHPHHIIFKSQRCWEVSLQLLMHNYHSFWHVTIGILRRSSYHITVNLKNVTKFSWQSFFYNLKHFVRYNQDFHFTSHITLQLIFVGLINL